MLSEKVIFEWNIKASGTAGAAIIQSRLVYITSLAFKQGGSVVDDFVNPGVCCVFVRQ